MPSNHHQKPTKRQRDSGFYASSDAPTDRESEQQHQQDVHASSAPPRPRLAPAYGTPAPTCSDIHNNNSYALELLSQPSDSDGPLQPQQGFFNSPVLDRFMTVIPDDAPDRHEASIAIKEGRVQYGENMAERKRREMEIEIQREELTRRHEANMQERMRQFDIDMTNAGRRVCAQRHV
ncbi:hypothetical protein K440DRAFT_57435 [Wilcoxina mikolae CBS 423.85]|nr:hypothetical protein K440DRAFT_57435 [Wilcoxina mikolae CBS 423.85]